MKLKFIVHIFLILIIFISCNQSKYSRGRDTIISFDKDHRIQLFKGPVKPPGNYILYDLKKDTCVAFYTIKIKKIDSKIYVISDCNKIKVKNFLEPVYCYTMFDYKSGKKIGHNSIKDFNAYDQKVFHELDKQKEYNFFQEDKSILRTFMESIEK